MNFSLRYEAKNLCLGLGGDLALIRDEVDYQRYRSVLQGISSSWRYWIGAKQRFWMWSSGKKGKGRNIPRPMSLLGGIPVGVY